MRKQTGFTLIELIVVIVVLGILAATALPRFFGAQSLARAAALNGARGAVSSAAALAHADQLVNQSGLQVTVAMDGQTVAMTNGYPDGTTAGIVLAAQLALTDWVTAGGGAATAITIIATNAATSASCSFIYTPATTTTGGFTVSASTTSGC